MTSWQLAQLLQSGASDAWGAAQYVPYIALATFFASAIDAVLPQPAPGSHWLPLRKMISFVALNLRNAAPGGQPPIATWGMRILTAAMMKQSVSSAVAAAGAAAAAAVETPTPAVRSVLQRTPALSVGPMAPAPEPAFGHSGIVSPTR